jgi:hypothetical protein
MHLNRAHALALAGSLSAAACGGESKHQGAAAASGAAAGTGGAGASGGAGGQGAGGAGTTGLDGGASGVGGSGAGRGGSGGSAGKGGSGAGGSAAGGSSGACSESTDTDQFLCPGDCSDPTAQTVTQQECGNIARSLKPYLANRALGCVVALPSAAQCELASYYDCIDRALKTSCLDITVADTCDQIVSACASGETPIDPGACMTYLSGLTGTGRAQLSGCAVDTCDLTMCVQSFAPIFIE